MGLDEECFLYCCSDSVWTGLNYLSNKDRQWAVLKANYCSMWEGKFYPN